MARAENPILTYYSPLSRSARRKVAFRLFILANLALVTLVTYWLGTDKTADRQTVFVNCALVLAGLQTFMPSIAYLLFAPRDRSRARQEELLAAGMTKWEILVGYCYPPLSVGVLLTGIYTVWLFAIAFLLALRHLYDGFGMDEFIVMLLMDLVGLGTLSVSAATRNWIRDPESTVRALAWVPLVILGMMTFSYILRYGSFHLLQNQWRHDELDDMLKLAVAYLASPLTVGIIDAWFTHRSMLEKLSADPGSDETPVPIGAS